MLTLLQDPTTHPILSLTYGTNITNAYIQIAQILKRATASPVARPVPPAPEPRVPPATPPTPTRQMPPDTPPVPEPRVVSLK
jgi:hypothetical protein